MELEGLAKKEIEKMEKILKEVKVKDAKALEVYNLALSYFVDAKHFLEKKDFIRAFEAIIICWAYLDACLHFGFLEVSKGFRKFFTLE
jgi:hypothetical protein